MTKPLTIRTDEQTLERLDAIARRERRSRNYVANRALEAYLRQVEGGVEPSETKQPTVPVVTRLEDLRGDVWPDEDADAFLDFLRAEREQSLAEDAERDRY